jgi:hypothetical protein
MFLLLDKLAGIILQFIVISRKLLLEIGVVIKPACKPILMVAAPFQAGTQVVQTMCENNTKNKQIVSVFLGNKLCNVASRLRNKGIAVKCPNHNGHCTANLAEDAVIGFEVHCEPAFHIFFIFTRKH